MDAFRDVIMGDAEPQEIESSLKRKGSQIETPQSRRKKIDEMEKRAKEESDAWWDQYRIGQFLKHPWRAETDRPFSEPPDINYRKIILEDQEEIEQLLQDQKLHFVERCLRYQKLDVQLENEILEEHWFWASEMLYDSVARPSGQEKEERIAFFEGLADNLGQDRECIKTEVENMRDEECFREANKNLKKGATQFWHFWHSCWYYYDAEKRQWLKEPQQRNAAYRERKAQWRKEALQRTQKSYFDCVRKRFYHFDEENSAWRGEAIKIKPYYYWMMQFDEKTGQMTLPSWVKVRLRGSVVNDADEISSPAFPEPGFESASESDDYRDPWPSYYFPRCPSQSDKDESNSDDYYDAKSEHQTPASPQSEPISQSAHLHTAAQPAVPPNTVPTP